MLGKGLDFSEESVEKSWGKNRLMKAVRSSSHVSIVPSLSSSNQVFASQNGDCGTESQSDNTVGSPHGFVIHRIEVLKGNKKVTQVIDVENWRIDNSRMLRWIVSLFEWNSSVSSMKSLIQSTFRFRYRITPKEIHECRLQQGNPVLVLRVECMSFDKGDGYLSIGFDGNQGKRAYVIDVGVLRIDNFSEVRWHCFFVRWKSSCCFAEVFNSELYVSGQVINVSTVLELKDVYAFQWVNFV
ncbi:hypothetical protein Tco_0942996 [Tanacetum coccineum]